MEAIESYLYHLIAGMCKEPESIYISAENRKDEVVFTVRAGAVDARTLIGVNGLTAQALQRCVMTAGYILNPGIKHSLVLKVPRR